MKENDLNRIVNKGIKRYGFSHKIADPMHGTGAQNPFDGFSVFYKKSWYWESKLLKGYQAFNFKKIEEHQDVNLTYIKNETPESECLIILGVYEPRKYFDIFLFSIEYINELMKNKKSILKKELLEMKKNGKFIPLFRDKVINDYTWNMEIDILEKIFRGSDLY